MTQRRILVPTDFSDHAQRAAELAVAIAAGVDEAEIVLLHVSPMPDYALLAVEPMYLPPKIWDRLWEREYAKIQTELDALELHLRGVANPTVHFTTSCRRGDPVAEIIDAARERAVDIIAMGSQGTDGALRFVFGGVAGKVARDAPCPVLIAPPEATTHLPRRALVAVDYSKFSTVAARLAADTLDRRGAITFLHVWQQPPLVSVEPFAEFADAMEQARGAAVDQIEAFASELGITDHRTKTRIEVGSPAHEILQCAQDIRADLIVMGSHGRHGVERLIGTTADRVLRNADATVLLVPERALDDTVPANEVRHEQDHRRNRLFR